MELRNFQTKRRLTRAFFSLSTGSSSGTSCNLNFGSVFRTRWDFGCQPRDSFLVISTIKSSFLSSFFFHRIYKLFIFLPRDFLSNHLWVDGGGGCVGRGGVSREVVICRHRVDVFFKLLEAVLELSILSATSIRSESFGLLNNQQ